MVWNGVPANILEPAVSLATGGTLTLKRSGKSRRTRWVDPRSVYFMAQIAPKRGIWHQKSIKKNPGVTPWTLSAGGGDPLPHPRRARGASSPVAGI